MSSRAQAQKAALGREIDDPDCIHLGDTLFSPLFADDRMSTPVPESPASGAAKKAPLSLPTESSITREELIATQRADTSLNRYFTCTESNSPHRPGQAKFLIKNGVLIRKWSPSREGEGDWEATEQVVAPAPYRHRILTLAHESAWAGHFGVNKTFELTIRHFFWPGQKPVTLVK